MCGCVGVCMWVVVLVGMGGWVGVGVLTHTDILALHRPLTSALFSLARSFSLSLALSLSPSIYHSPHFLPPSLLFCSFRLSPFLFLSLSLHCRPVLLIQEASERALAKKERAAQAQNDSQR